MRHSLKIWATDSCGYLSDCFREEELLDGFKRLRAGRQLGFSELTVRPLEVSFRGCRGQPAATQSGRASDFRPGGGSGGAFALP